ncbi:MAG: hypothetical protein RL213_61 [Bacteroidota bacterium]|jgi:hypothetical protein
MSFKDVVGEDRLLKGVAVGLVAVPLVYWVLEGFGSLLSEASGNPEIFRAPRVQLYALATLIILCRILMVNMKLEETGRGMLLVVCLSAFGYLFYSYKIRHGF